MSQKRGLSPPLCRLMLCVVAASTACNNTIQTTLSTRQGTSTGIGTASQVTTTINAAATALPDPLATASATALGTSILASVTATPLPSLPPLASPTPLPLPGAPGSLTAAGGVASIAMTWTPAVGAVSYNLYYGTSAGLTPGTGTQVLLGANPTYTLSGLANGTTYYAVVTAINSQGGEGAASAAASATPLALLSAPLGLQTNGDNTKATLTWTAVTGASSYHVYFGGSTVSTSSGTLLSVGNVTSYVHTGLTNYTVYGYVIATVNANGNEGPASTAMLTVPQVVTGGSGAPLPSPPAGLNATTSLCLFQATCTSNAANYTGSATAEQGGVNGPYTLAVYPDPYDSGNLKMLIGDRGNNRVLIFNHIPTAATAVPDVVVGQADFVSNSVNAGVGSTTAYGYSTNTAVTVCTNGAMFVADKANNRVLGYNHVPTANDQAADFVIGQSSFTGNSPGTSATQMNNPYGVYCFNNELFIVDRGNNRILVYNQIPTATNPTASFVIGQADFVSSGSACSPLSFFQPYDLVTDGTNLYVADGSNNRVVVYSPIPTAIPTASSAVSAFIGQPNGGTGTAGGTGSCRANQGGSTTANTLTVPEGLAIQNGILAVDDNSNNNRVMFFALPASTNEAASYQWGQPNFTSTSTYSTTAAHYSAGRGLVFAGTGMWAVDYYGNRVMAFQLPYTP